MMTFSALAARKIYCQSHQQSLLVYGHWQLLSAAERDALLQRKSELVAQLPECWSIPLPASLNAMVVSELISEDTAQFGLFYLAPEEMGADENRLTFLISELYQAYPLFDCCVVWETSGLALQFTDTLSPPDIVTLEKDFAHPEAFIAHQLNYAHSVFTRGMLRIFRARCNGRLRWGIWLHHLTADADFIPQLLNTVKQLLKDRSGVAPDYNFLQQMWLLQDRLGNQKAALLEAWSQQREWLNAARPLPLMPTEAVAPVSYEVTLAAGENAFARAARCLSDALLACGVSEPVLAVSPVSLRYSMESPASGCYVTLVPLLLAPGFNTDIFEEHRMREFEHALLPQEEISRQTGMDFRHAQVMINLIETYCSCEPFTHRPDLHNRKAITLTLFRTTEGSWRGTLSTLLGQSQSQRLAAAFQGVADR